jgi:hypothetical protein
MEFVVKFHSVKYGGTVLLGGVSGFGDRWVVLPAALVWSAPLVSCIFCRSHFTCLVVVVVVVTTRGEEVTSHFTKNCDLCQREKLPGPQY